MHSRGFAAACVLLALFVLAACELPQGPAGPRGPVGPAGEDLTAGPARLTGEVELGPPNGEDVSGLTYVVFLDNDSDPTNGAVTQSSGTVPGAQGSSPFAGGFTYDLGEVSAGDYYLFAFIDRDGDGEWDGYIGNGDDEYANYFGLFPGTLAGDEAARPDRANVTVPENGYLDLDLRVDVTSGGWDVPG